MNEYTWQPIETAPKDNKRLLFLARFDRYGLLHRFDYDGIWKRECESWEIPEMYHYWASAGGIEEPSHWMYQPDWFASLRGTGVIK